MSAHIKRSALRTRRYRCGDARMREARGLLRYQTRRRLSWVSGVLVPPTSSVDGLYNGAVTDLSVGQDVGAQAAAVDQLPKYALGSEAFQM